MSHDVLESRITAEPTFEELRRALPAELQGEFDALGRWVSHLPALYPAGYGERTYDWDALSTDEKVRHDRFTELSTLARHNLIVIIGWTPPEQPPASRGFMKRVQETLASLV